MNKRVCLSCLTEHGEISEMQRNGELICSSLLHTHIFSDMQSVFDNSVPLSILPDWIKFKKLTLQKAENDYERKYNEELMEDW